MTESGPKESASAVRALVVDDEPLARQLVASLLQAEADVEICGVAASGRQALAAVAELQPDVVFIDIRMPGLNGIGVIREVAADSAPLFVIVTAFESHAVEAFDVRAFDYVLKPIDKTRFKRAVDDVRAAVLNRRALGGAADAERAIVADGQEKRGDPHYLRLRAGERVLAARFNDVRYFEACNQYVRVHIGNESFLLSTESLGSLQDQAAPESFFRVHRGFLVNSRFVQSVAQVAGGGSQVVLIDGRRLPVSRRNGDVVERLLVRLAARLGSSTSG